MKKVILILSLFILLSGCNPKSEIISPVILEFNLKCEKAFYMHSNEAFAIAFQVHYQNVSDYTIYLENSPRVSFSPDANENSTGFILDKGQNSLISLSNRVSNKYIPLKENTESFFYLYLVNRSSIEDLIKSNQQLSIRYVGKNLSPTMIGKTDKSIILKTNTISISLKNINFIKVSEEDMLNENKLSRF